MARKRTYLGQMSVVERLQRGLPPYPIRPRNTSFTRSATMKARKAVALLAQKRRNQDIVAHVRKQIGADCLDRMAAEQAAQRRPLFWYGSRTAKRTDARWVQFQAATVWHALVEFYLLHPYSDHPDWSRALHVWAGTAWIPAYQLSVFDGGMDHNAGFALPPRALQQHAGGLDVWDGPAPPDQA